MQLLLDKLIGVILTMVGIVCFAIYLITVPLTGEFNIGEFLLMAFMLVFYTGMVMLGIRLIDSGEPG